jgi:glutamate-1-semialdehyde aminotransferase
MLLKGVAFRRGGILARCTGAIHELDCGSSMVTVHFPHDESTTLSTPEAVFDPQRCDIELREKVLGLALLVEDVHLILAHGAASTAHTEDDVAFLAEACRRAATHIAHHR